MTTCRYCKGKSYHTFDLGAEKLELCMKHCLIWSAQMWFQHLSPTRRWEAAEKLVEVVILTGVRDNQVMNLTKSIVNEADSPDALLKRLKEEKQ